MSFEKDTGDWIDLNQYCFGLPSGVDWWDCLKWRGPRNSKADFVIIPVVWLLWLLQPFLKISLNSSVVQSLSRVWLFAIPWTVARLVSLVPHCLPEYAQVHVHWIGDAIQQSHALLLLLLNSNNQRLSCGDWKKKTYSLLTGLSNWIALGIDGYWHCIYRGTENQLPPCSPWVLWWSASCPPMSIPILSFCHNNRCPADSDVLGYNWKWRVPLLCPDRKVIGWVSPGPSLPPSSWRRTADLTCCLPASVPQTPRDCFMTKISFCLVFNLWIWEPLFTLT